MERKMKKFGTGKIKSAGIALILRPVLKKDAKMLNGIINDEDVNEFLMVEMPLSLASTRKVIDEDAKKKLWIAVETGGEVVGSIHLRPGIGRKDVTCSFGIAFSRKVHGKGVAAAAMRECFNWMRKNGFATCTAEVFDENSRARKFYRKLGFREVAHVPNVRRKKNGKLGGEYVIQKNL